MKLLALLCAAAFAAPAAPTGEIKTVYILPMSNGLDQFIAIKLTTGVVLQVVTDPQKADVILTDRIGAAFEGKLDDLYGPKKKQDDPDEVPKPLAPASHARGTVFLVDRKSRNVIWSAYEPVKGNSTDAMNRTADKIAAKLFKDVKGK